MSEDLIAFLAVLGLMALVMLTGATGMALETRASRKKIAPKKPGQLTQADAVCGCSHSRAMHARLPGDLGDERHGTCGESVFDPLEDGKRPCRCQGYDGPQPVNGFYVPDI